MKTKIRSIVRNLAGKRGIGRLVRIGVAVVRLPEFRAEYLANVNRAQVQLGYIPMPTATDSQTDASSGSFFETQQLPTLLRTVAELNHRQLSSDNDRANMVKSVPIALRRLTRDLADTRQLLEQQRVEADQSTSRLGAQFDDRLARQAAELRNAAALDIATLREEWTGAAAALRQQLQADAEAVQRALAQANAEAARLQAEQAEAARLHAEQTEAAERRHAEELSAVNSRLDGALDSISYLLGRVEFVRRETMFEMRYGKRDPASSTSSTAAATEILATEKVAAARRQGARVNLGCGHIAMDGYLNIDRRALPGVDIVAEVNQLPFDSNELAEIHSAHLLEHFPQEQLRRELLPYYFSLLQPGGKFAAVVPDAEAMLREYAAGTYPYSDLREVLYGGQDYDGDFHFNMFTPASMGDYLREAGFDNVQLIAGGRKNGQCYEFEITADKPQTAVAEKQ